MIDQTGAMGSIMAPAKLPHMERVRKNVLSAFFWLLIIWSTLAAAIMFGSWIASVNEWFATIDNGLCVIAVLMAVGSTILVGIYHQDMFS